jgi:hypothetical protein
MFFFPTEDLRGRYETEVNGVVRLVYRTCDWGPLYDKEIVDIVFDWTPIAGINHAANRYDIKTLIGLPCLKGVSIATTGSSLKHHLPSWIWSELPGCHNRGNPSVLIWSVIPFFYRSSAWSWWQHGSEWNAQFNDEKGVEWLNCWNHFNVGPILFW